MKVIIVGGVAGGASAAARLRRLDEEAEIILLEKGAYISYANCGLPYYIGGVIEDKEELTIQTPESFHARFNVDVRTGSAVVAVDSWAKTVQVLRSDGESYTDVYDALILSPGAAPVWPPIPGAEGEGVFVLRTVPDTFAIAEYVRGQKPKTAVVVGGGYIGVEMAENLAGLGIAVNVVEMENHIIAPLDADMAVFAQRALQKAGVRLVLGAGVQEIQHTEKGMRVVLPKEELSADLVLLATGVRADTGFLEGSGIQMNARGGIVVDAHMRTSAPDVWAVGDAVEITDFVSGKPAMVPLAGPANKQGRIAADNVCGLDTVYEGTQGSSILKIFDTTVAVTGLNERAAKAAGVAYDKVYLFAQSHAGYYPGGQEMAMKVLFAPDTGRILGAQIVGGDGVDKRCDVLATVIRMKGTARDCTELELCYAPPYGSAKDPVNMAGYIMENVLDGSVKQYHWDEVANLPRDGSVQLVDARTAKEFNRGALEGFVNIPLDEMRENLHKLDTAKPVYVHCLSGQRSYAAARLLQQHGFTAYNLAGGYRLYKTVTDAGYTEP